MKFLIFLFSEIEKVIKESYKNQKGQSRMEIKKHCQHWAHQKGGKK
jgi:hypothetical protein